MNSLESLHNEKRNCSDDIIAYVAHEWGCDYEFCLSDALMVDFNNDPLKKIGERIIISGGIHKTFLKEYHGIAVKAIIFENYCESIKIIKEQIEKKIPICIGIDTYLCPWDKNYQIHHNYNHCCIAIDLDHNHNIFCVDPFNSKRNVTLPLKSLEMGCKWCWTFKLSEVKDITQDDCITVLTTSTSKVLLNKSYQQMINFADCIEQYLDYDLEFEAMKNIWHSPLIFMMGRIILGRNRFVLLLKYIFEKCKLNEAEILMDGLDTIIERWCEIRSLLIKGYATNEQIDTKKIVADKIRKTAMAEEDLIRRIVSC